MGWASAFCACDAPASQNFGSPRATLREGFCNSQGIRPSKETILSQLQSLYSSNFGRMADQTRILGIIRLLSWLPHLTQDERTRLIIPDAQGMLRTFGTICYNDVGPRACYVDIGNNTLTHPDVAVGLADRLGLRRLGLIGAGIICDD